MAQETPLQTPHSSEWDRRRAVRIPFEPLRVRLDGTREGILVDLSLGGALLQLPFAPPLDRQFMVHIERKHATVTVQARVVRSVKRSVRSESATLARMEYCVALEFLDPPDETSGAIQRIIQGN